MTLVTSRAATQGTKIYIWKLGCVYGKGKLLTLSRLCQETELQRHNMARSSESDVK